MPVLLPSTELALSQCRAHWALQGGIADEFDPAILSYLTRYVVVLMCAEIETIITQMIRDRVDLGGGDGAVRKFVYSVSGNLIRNAKVAEIGDKLGRFGDEFKAKYDEIIDSSVGEEGVAKLGMAVGNRDQLAHSTPPNLTFRELEEAYTVAEAVVGAARMALGLP